MNRYDAVYSLAFPFFIANALVKRTRQGKYRESLPAMLGRRLPAKPLHDAASQRIWMHSVSVGETVAAGGVYRALHAARPGWEFLISTTTETGQAQARRTMEGADHFTYAPADFSWIVKGFYDSWRPTAYLFFETEIWPNTLLEAHRRHIPVFLVNGKLSERSANRYCKVRGMITRSLAGVRRFFMQTQQDAGRLARIIGEDKRIEVTGNIKFDALPEPLSPDERNNLRLSWGLQPTDVLVMAGSTHDKDGVNEEDIVWRAFQKCASKNPTARLALAPRHPERFGQVAEWFASKGARVHRTSKGPNPRPADTNTVILIDQMGVLARWFGTADIALLGGSWAPVGGHNLLEPAVHGIPVLRGPHMHSQSEIVRVLGPHNGAPAVEDRELGGMLRKLLSDEAERRRLGVLAADAAISSRGSAARVVKAILEDLDRKSR